MHSEVGLEGSEAMWSTAVQTTEDSSCQGWLIVTMQNLKADTSTILNSSQKIIL